MLCMHLLEKTDLKPIHSNFTMSIECYISDNCFNDRVFRVFSIHNQIRLQSEIKIYLQLFRYLIKLIVKMINTS